MTAAASAAESGDVAPPPIDFHLALDRVGAAAQRHAAAAGRECVALADAAGRRLCEDQHARIDVPPFDNSAMDGFALRVDDLELARDAGLPLAATSMAGEGMGAECPPRACVRVATGAPLPSGADTVVPQEHASWLADGRVRLRSDATAGAFVRRAGGDVAAGTLLAAAGTRVTAARTALLAAGGVAQVQVARLPTIAVLVSGDELRQPGAVLGPGQIHDSNTPMLAQLLAEAGAPALTFAQLPDQPDVFEHSLLEACGRHRLVIAAGGASVGARDYLPSLARRHGQVHVWRVRVKPGMPFLCASVGDALLLGLPGNPVSAFCCFHAFVRPVLAVFGAADPTARLSARLVHPVEKPHDRHELRRGSVYCRGGAMEVRLAEGQESHQLRAVAAGNALVHLPPECRRLAAGALVDVQPYAAILPA